MKTRVDAWVKENDPVQNYMLTDGNGHHSIVQFSAVWYNHPYYIDNVLKNAAKEDNVNRYEIVAIWGDNLDDEIARNQFVVDNHEAGMEADPDRFDRFYSPYVNAKKAVESLMNAKAILEN